MQSIPQLSHITPQVGLYVDADNLFIQTRAERGREARLDYRALLDYAHSVGRVIDATVYLSRPAGSTRPLSLEFRLKHCGFRVAAHNRIRLPDRREKSLAEVALAMDVGIGLARRTVSYFVIGSGDSSFPPSCDRAVGLSAGIEFVGPDLGSSSHLVVAASHFTPASQVSGFITGGKC